MNRFIRDTLFITVALGITASPLLGAEEDMQKYLIQTQRLARTGEYKEALERFIWFHEHALEHDPNMFGVRLSFALSSWHELGKKYPPAMFALEQKRDQATQQLLDGNGDLQLFAEASAINHVFLDDDRTSDLFVQLDQKNPELAKKCWRVVKEEMIRNKRLDLVKKYIGPLANEFENAKKSYDEVSKLYDDKRFSGSSIKSINEKNFEKSCVQLIKIGIALDDVKSAREIQKKALAVLDSEKIRKALPPDDPTEKADE